MRKTLFALLAMAACAANAEITLYDNGPIVTHAGQGAGGLDVSMCSLDPNTAGSNRKFFGPDPEFYTAADDFTLNQNATLTKVILQGYETNANTPTWTSLTVNLWSGKPGAGGSVVATATSVSFAQSNVYRVFNGTANLLNTARKVNLITANFNNIALTSGTNYWVSCQVTAGGASGWANYVMDINPADPNNPITRAGNALQFRDEPAGTGVNYGWWPMLSGTTNIVNVALPMEVRGEVASTTETLAPTAEQILLGTNNSGGNLGSWAADDNNARTICKLFVPNSTSPFIRADLNYTTTKTSPTAISFDVKVSTHTPGPQGLTLLMKNQTTSAYVVTSVNNANIVNGTTYNGVPTGTLSDYRNGSGLMVGRIEVKQTGPSTSLFPCASFEFAQMKVTG